MYIAMNRFKVRKGFEAEFEEIWRNRDGRLKDVPGFGEFQMLRGAQHEDYTLYASHTLWDDRAAFEAWTKSEAFRETHRSAGGSRHVYLDSPNFEGFEVFLEEKKTAQIT